MHTTAQRVGASSTTTSISPLLHALHPMMAPVPFTAASQKSAAAGRVAARGLSSASAASTSAHCGPTVPATSSSSSCSSALPLPRHSLRTAFGAAALPRGVACRGAATAAAPAAASPAAGADVEYEAVIGIECHVQLLTKTKAFCGCASEFGSEPNSNVCPVCLGHPGTLPVLNAEMVTLAVRAGLALGSDIAAVSKFDRKQYFYPDLPKGYQISQYDEPICSGGRLEVEVDGVMKSFGIIRAHLEEDAGKIVYAGADRLSGADYSLVDYNRAGVPLLEIVSAPDMRSGRDAAAYGEELRRVLRTCGVTDGNMAEGSMRVDVNVSVMPKGSDVFGTRVEIKNMNSFSNMQKAIDFEIERQVSLLRAGRGAEIVMETRLWDEIKLVTNTMRKKEGLADYRYFPEPDLPPLTVSPDFIANVKASMPELPAAKRARYAGLGLTRGDIAVLCDETSTSDFFDAVLGLGAPVRQAANWIQGDIMAYCKEKKCGMDGLAITPAALVDMIKLIEDGTISGKIAKDVLPELLQGKGNKGVRAYIESRGMMQISDTGAVEAMIQAVLDANPKQLAEYRGGKTKLQGFFEGQVMKESKGRVNPGLMKEILLKKLKGE